MPAPLRNDKALKKGLKLLESGKARSFEDAATKSGCPPSTLRKRWRDDHGPGPLPGAKSVSREQFDDEEAEPTPQERELARRLAEAKRRGAATNHELRIEKQRTKDLETELGVLRRQQNLIDDLELTGRPDWMLEARDAKPHHGTLLLQFSDSHVGEVVEQGELAGYNRFDMDIAEKRVRRTFSRTIKMADEYLAGVKYDGIVVNFGGDIVSGDIHEELRETNETSNYDAILEVEPWIEEGLDALAKKFGKVHTVSVPGNHPRDRKKNPYKKRSKHSADTFIMKHVARAFRGDDRITFDIPDSLFANFSIYDMRFRAEHGDAAKGGSGIQGAMLPLALLTHRRRKQAQSEGHPFDVLLLSHWHQLMLLPSKGFCVNGAIKGYDEYASGNGFDPEPPQQSLMVVTPEHGISIPGIPLFVGDRKAEGW